jgi:diacylglycerol kinase (ATP)
MNNDSTNASPEPSENQFQLTSWKQKFGVAGRGIKIAVLQEKSFIFHFSVTGLVLAAGFALGITRVEWCIIVLAIMAGLTTELLNTSIEYLAKAITREHNPHIRDALDVASGAVSTVAIGAIVLGLLVIGNALWVYFS